MCMGKGWEYKEVLMQTVIMMPLILFLFFGTSLHSDFSFRCGKVSCGTTTNIFN